MKNRYLQKHIIDFLKKKMVFLGGARQVGKTTLGLSLLKPSTAKHPAYLNWDVLKSQAKIKKGELPYQPLIILDEVHKFYNWRSLVKGFYDQHHENKKFLITGSARLNIYRRGGDSLLGRYRYIRLHPFSISELNITSKSDFNHLLKFGGFPEPFLSNKIQDWKLWQRERLSRLVQDDIRSLESLKEYSRIELLAEALSSKVGSILSVKSLCEDLNINFRTAEHWITILENVYYCYRIMPYGSDKIKAIKKSQKLYLWDWSSCENEGARLENMLASHLLKYCHFLEDIHGEKMELRFLRDNSQREIDFVVLKNNKPQFAVECKSGDSSVSKNIFYFKQKTKIPKFYQVHTKSKDYEPETGIRVLPFITFCNEVGLC